MLSANPAVRRTGRRRRLLLAAGLAGAVGVAAVLVLVATGGDGARRPAGGPSGAIGGPAGTPTAAPGAPSGSPGGSAPPSGPATGQPSGPTSVRFSFDAATTRAIADTAGLHSLRTGVAAGGTITFVRRGGGRAVQFPPRCTGEPATCPRAILETTQGDLLNPGTRPLRYGASVLMTEADTGAGANVVQKGYSTDGGSQFKLQIDGKAGRPSCVLASGQDIYRLVAPISVADGRWHTITCARNGGVLSVDVDGRTFSRRVPATLSIVNRQPLRIGGKGTAPNNDQYAGRIDDVFIAIS
ncbi:MAG TPA: LamG-like jellyroll fold domain-containing protein [Pilimelia sp.]|nr:LamG-like jellyroll fold domain-containing protein [Pilimelia sp.]